MIDLLIRNAALPDGQSGIDIAIHGERINAKPGDVVYLLTYAPEAGKGDRLLFQAGKVACPLFYTGKIVPHTV